MFNRLPLDEFATTGDRALAACSRFKFDVMRIDGDDEPTERFISFQLHGHLDPSDPEAASLIAAILAAVGNGGAA